MTGGRTKKRKGLFVILIKRMIWWFGDPVVKTLPCNAYQLDPWYGKIPYAIEQLSPVRSN